MKKITVKELTEQEAIRKIQEARAQRESDCLKEVQEALDPILRKYNCSLATEVSIHINGKAVGMIIKSL